MAELSDAPLAIELKSDEVEQFPKSPPSERVLSWSFALRAQTIRPLSSAVKSCARARNGLVKCDP